jgi:hypothetical protein
LFSSAWLFAKVASPLARHIFGGLMRLETAFVNERNFAYINGLEDCQVKQPPLLPNGRLSLMAHCLFLATGIPR